MHHCGRSLSLSTAVTRSLLVIFKTWFTSILSVSHFAQGHFPVNAKEFTLKVTYCGMDLFFFFLLTPLSSAGSSNLRPEPLWFWGLSSTFSTQLFRRLIQRINAILTFITNQHLNAERGARIWKEHEWKNCWIGNIYYKLENILLINLLWLFWFCSCFRPVFCWSALPQFKPVRLSLLAPCWWVKSGSSTNEWRAGHTESTPPYNSDLCRFSTNVKGREMKGKKGKYLATPSICLLLWSSSGNCLESNDSFVS